MTEAVNIRNLEDQLWESADLLRAGSKLTSNEYCMPVLGLLFLRYAYGRFKRVEAEILKDRPCRNGRQLPVEASDFTAKSALFLPREAQYEYLVNLPADISSIDLHNTQGHVITSLTEAVNNAMELVEAQSEQLAGVLPKNYDIFTDEMLSELLRIFNNNALDDVGGDVMGRVYEYFLNKFAKNIASDDGVFFTPKSLVKMIVNIIEPQTGVLLDPACGSGGMFVQTGDFVNSKGMSANSSMTFYGQEKIDYNGKICLMNMAVHGLTARIAVGNDANTFYNDVYSLEGQCDYVMANPPFNVDKVKEETAVNAGRLPFGLPGVNDAKEFGNANYLWISYFYDYLNEKGRAGFVMASSATDSQNKDKDIREKLVNTGHVDVMISVGNNFFYTKSLPCTLWFFDKGKAEDIKDKVLFIDARNYYTVVDRTLNEWSPWQLKNINAAVWLYRGNVQAYKDLLKEYKTFLAQSVDSLKNMKSYFAGCGEPEFLQKIQEAAEKVKINTDKKPLETLGELEEELNSLKSEISELTEEAVNKYTAMTKEDYKAFREEFKKNFGIDPGNLTQLKKKLNTASEKCVKEIDELTIVVKEAVWLYEKFGEGEYKDIPGFCKIADLKEIEEKGYSLTPGAYVGVAPQKDDGVDFAARMKEIHSELLTLQSQSNDLMNTISKNFQELGL